MYRIQLAYDTEHWLLRTP